jgi:hypothetical protein
MSEEKNFDTDERFGGDPAKLYQSYRELEKKLGSSLPAPTSDAGLEDLYRRLGAPDSADGYTVPDGVDPTLADELRSFAAGAKLTPDQFSKMAAAMQETKAAEFAASQQAVEATRSAVEAEYGDGFTEAQARAVRALEALPEADREGLDLSDPGTFKLLERLGARAPGQPTSAAPPTGAVAAGFDPVAVAAETRKIMGSDAFLNRTHPENAFAKEEYAKRITKLMDKGFEGAFDPRLMPKNPLF